MCTQNIFYATYVGIVIENILTVLAICGYFTKVFVYLCKWKSVCLFKKSLFPGDHNDYICFQDPVEHTQKVQKEPFSLHISDIFCFSLQITVANGELIYCLTHFFKSEFYNM